MCGVGVLKFIDDEGTEFSAQPLEAVPPTLDFFNQRRVFTGQNDGSFDVRVAPGPLLTVFGDDGRVVEGAHHVFGPHAAIGLRAAGQEKVGRHALHVFEIDQPPLSLDDVEGPSVGLVDHEHVLHQPSCKRCSRAQAAFRWRDRERMSEGRGPKVGSCGNEGVGEPWFEFQRRRGQGRPPAVLRILEQRDNGGFARLKAIDVRQLGPIGVLAPLWRTTTRGPTAVRWQGVVREARSKQSLGEVLLAHDDAQRTVQPAKLTPSVLRDTLVAPPAQFTEACLLVTQRRFLRHDVILSPR